MPGVYGGLIIILMYGTNETVAEQDFYLITQNGDDILTSTSQRILVQT